MRLKLAKTFPNHVGYSEHVFLMYSGDKASWCLAHGWCVAVCMLLVRFHCYMSSLHLSYAMHYDRAHHPILCHNMLQSYTCMRGPLRPRPTQVIPAQRWSCFYRPTGTTEERC